MFMPLFPFDTAKVRRLVFLAKEELPFLAFPYRYIDVHQQLCGRTVVSHTTMHPHNTSMRGGCKRPKFGKNGPTLPSKGR